MEIESEMKRECNHWNWISEHSKILICKMFRYSKIL